MTIRNLDGLFQPKSVAILGPGPTLDASAGPGGSALATVAVLIDNWQRGNSKLPITLVGVDPQHLPRLDPARIRVAADLDGLGAMPDLAIVLGGAAGAPALVDRLGAGGTRAAVFLARGFDEWSPAAIRQTLEAARPHTLRVVGPGSLGVIAPHVGLDLSLAAQPAVKGDLALVSRSGAVINAMLAWGAAHAVGFSAVVSLGQKADVDVGDLLDYFAGDFRTRAILIHLDSIGTPVKFLSAARAAARSKPVVVIRSGASRDNRIVGATQSSRLASTDAVYDAAFRRAGLLRVDSIDGLFDAVETITRVKPTPCRAVAIVANGRSLATIAADQLESRGGVLVEPNETTSQALQPLTRAGPGPLNPVTVSSEASAATFAGAIAAVLADPGTDAVLAIHAPNAFVDSLEVAGAVADLARVQAKKLGRRKPIIAAFLDERPETRAVLQAAGVPCHATPEEAVRSYLHLLRYANAQERLMATPPSLPKDFTPEPALARAIVADTLAGGRQWLTPIDVRRLLEAYDIPVAPTALARDAAEAAVLARAHFARGAKVAVKVAASAIPFKSDVDGVRLGLQTEADVIAAAGEILERIGRAFPDKPLDGVIVMPMIEKRFGVELLCGIADDAVFGPTVVFGRGGTAVEVIADRALDLVPLDMNLARAMIAETRVAKLLAGYRNRPPADLDAIALTLVKLSQLATDIPELRELDLNPILADEAGVIVLDARVRVAPLAERPGRLGHPRLAIRPYPKEWERHVALRDGRELFIRPIRPEDEALYPDFLSEVSAEDIRLRFFAPIKEFGHSFLARLTQLDYQRAVAFGAIDVATEKLLGVVRLHADPDHRTGEYAILLRSDLKGQGLGWALMQLMVEWAREDGLALVKGEVLRENRTMIEMCRALGFSIKASPDDEAIAIVSLPVDSMPAPAAA